MKIGCLTWWRNNYGSILQAYALQTYIEQLGDYDYEIINQYSAKMASVDNLVDKLKNCGLRRTVKRLFFRFGMPGLRARVSKLQQFVDDNLHVSKNVYNAETMVFSSMYHKQFFMLRKLGKAQMQRIHHLQKKLCLGNRIVNDNTEPEEILQMELPVWNNVDNAINKYRLISRNYLDNALTEAE